MGTQWGPSGDPAPRPQKGHSPQFLAYICCRQMAGWIKMPLGMEVGLCPGHIVLDGDPAPPPQKKGGHSPPPIFGPCMLWPNGWMDQDASWYEGRPRPRHIVTLFYMETQLIPQRGTAPNFRPMSIVAKWSLISATTEHL